MERLLENKVCIITGAAQGIGKSIAERFASDGALVYACDRAEGVMDEWAKACSEKYGTRVCPLYFDVTDAVAVKSAFMSVFKQERRIDVLVNNAGVVFNKKIGMILRPETELMFRVNVIAVIEMVQLVSRLMARGRLHCEYSFGDSCTRLSRPVCLFSNQGGDYSFHQVCRQGTGISRNPCECGGSGHCKDGAFFRTLRRER